jgi:hypothetical protein
MEERVTIAVLALGVLYPAFYHLSVRQSLHVLEHVQPSNHVNGNPWMAQVRLIHKSKFMRQIVSGDNHC